MQWESEVIRVGDLVIMDTTRHSISQKTTQVRRRRRCRRLITRNTMSVPTGECERISCPEPVDYLCPPRDYLLDGDAIRFIALPSVVDLMCANI